MIHRTERQVRRWLRTRLWYRKYKRNLHNEMDDPEVEATYLYGLQGEQTISSAFCYRETPEGIDYWGKREKRFLQWYYYQGKEILRFKWKGYTVQFLIKDFWK